RALDRTASGAGLAFDVVVIGAAIIVFSWLRRTTPKLWLRWLVMMTGVCLFELFTSPMWHNEHLGRWAYVYCDVSWVLTLGWTTMLMAVVALVDRWRPRWTALQRFGLCMAILLSMVTLAEISVVQLGI